MLTTFKHSITGYTYRLLLIETNTVAYVTTSLDGKTNFHLSIEKFIIVA